MSIVPPGLNSLENTSIPANSRLVPSILSPLNSHVSPMDARLVAARLPGLAMYGSPYASPNFPGYLPYGPAAAAVAAAADPSAFYSPLGPGENSDAWRAGLSQAAAAAYYDPSMAAHYGYGYGPMGLSDGARRKNATRETTSTLKAWLNEHRKNPYPTKGEKIMLAIITKMTLTQVSTWFANARRRLKKENKMTWSPRNRCGEDDEDDDDMADEGHHSNENANSRSPTPQDLPPNGLATHGGEKRPLNGHTSGGESLSDEGASYSDGRDESMRHLHKHDHDLNDKKEEKLSPASRPISSDESRVRIPSSHFSRHHPYANPRSSPSFGSLPSNISPPTQARPGIPFPSPIPHPLAGAAQPSGMLHPGVPGQFNHAAAASILAATRGHPLPPNLMAALNEQAHLHHYQQALQNLPINPFLSSPPDSKSITSVSNPSPSPSASSQVSSTSPAMAKVTSTSSVTTPTKPKIWSIADVATSSDTKSSHKSKGPETKPMPLNMQEDTCPKDISNVRSWMDNMLHHKLAAAMSGQNGLPGPMTPHQLQQLASGLNPIGHGPIVPPNGVRVPQPFPGFADLMAAQEKANAAMREAGRTHEIKSSQDLIERASLSSTSHSPELRDLATERNLGNRYNSSPSGSYHCDGSLEAGDKK